MRMNKQIVVTDWINEKPRLGSFLKLTLSSEERRILRGKRLTDCNQEIISRCDRLICFAFHDSETLLNSCRCAEEMGKVVSLLFFD